MLPHIMKLKLFVTLLLCAAIPMLAQLPTPNADGNIATSAAANLSVVQLTDPWGTSIEVSQGLKAAK